MSLKEDYGNLVQKVIEKNYDKAIKKNEFCNSRLGEFLVIENENVKIVFSCEDKSCNVYRKANDNPVFCQDANGKVYRIHGEFGRIKADLEEMCK
jgi:hypothetical protein